MKELQPPIEITQQDLPLHCPTTHTSLWDAHPKVFLDIVKHGLVQCPYCGTRYQFKGESSSSH